MKFSIIERFRHVQATKVCVIEKSLRTQPEQFTKITKIKLLLLHWIVMVIMK